MSFEILDYVSKKRIKSIKKTLEKEGIETKFEKTSNSKIYKLLIPYGLNHEKVLDKIKDLADGGFNT